MSQNNLLRKGRWVDFEFSHRFWHQYQRFHLQDNFLASNIHHNEL